MSTRPPMSRAPSSALGRGNATSARGGAGRNGRGTGASDRSAAAAGAAFPVPIGNGRGLAGGTVFSATAAGRWITAGGPDGTSIAGSGRNGVSFSSAGRAGGSLAAGTAGASGAATDTDPTASGEGCAATRAAASCSGFAYPDGGVGGGGSASTCGTPVGRLLVGSMAPASAESFAPQALQKRAGRGTAVPHSVHTA